MPETRLVQHPLGWSMARFAAWQQAYPSTFRVEAPPQPLGAPNRIDISDLRSVLLEGAEDFKAVRTDVIFLSILYPLIGLMMGNIVLGAQLFSLAFPLAAGFALLGPLFGAGLYEMSRQREAGFEVNWASAFDAFRSPAIGSIALLGVVLSFVGGLLAKYGRRTPAAKVGYGAIALSTGLAAVLLVFAAWT